MILILGEVDIKSCVILIVNLIPLSSPLENDSFNTFEEILTIAKTEEVDFVLLGGDLFHENKPKPATFQRTVDILQKHCLGPRCVT